LKQGLLNIGEPLAVPVIAELKRWKEKEDPFLEILDCPPGASCPMVEAVSGADFVLLVTEPTPFGLHDLKAAYQVARKLDIPSGVIINRVGLNGREVEVYCRENKLPVLAQIPLDMNIGKLLAQGKTLLDVDGKYQDQLLEVLGQVKDILKERRNLG
jgi:MinD superfamily P-loop ATPase